LEEKNWHGEFGTIYAIAEKTKNMELNTMKNYQKEISLPSGQKIVLRKPQVPQDLVKLASFFSALPLKTRNYLRYDVTSKSLLSQRLESIDWTNHWRLVAEFEGEIVGDGSMDREPFGWTRHVAYLRAVVDPRVSGRGVYRILFKELVVLGSDMGIERFFTEVLKEQQDLIDKLQGEGFAYEATRKGYAKDLKGRAHDVVVLSNDRQALWNALDEQVEDLDIQLPRILSGA
jgi:N-acetylglutamate synthase-like GNAT family acetyltransferase